MATLQTLTLKVTDIIQDSSFTDDDIKSYLNQGVQEIAGGMLSALGNYTTPPLSNLLTIDTVDTATDAAYVSMPATFQRDLVFAANEDGVEIDINNSWRDFVQTEPLLDRSGRIYEVIEQGGSLYYQGIPTSSEEITVHFYRLPVDMSDNDDTPDGLPAHLHIPLLVNYACYKIFELIEDGLEGPGVNTKRYEQRFLQALKTLELSMPRDTNALFLGD